MSVLPGQGGCLFVSFLATIHCGGASKLRKCGLVRTSRFSRRATLGSNGGDMRTPAIGALIAAFGLGCAASPVAQVTLDAQALEAVEKANPDRFRRVSEVVRVASEEGCESAAKVLKAQFDVRDAYCAPNLLLTSLPPKQRLTFTMEGTPYIVNVPVYTVGASGTSRAPQAAPK